MGSIRSRNYYDEQLYGPASSGQLNQHYHSRPNHSISRDYDCHRGRRHVHCDDYYRYPRCRRDYSHHDYDYDYPRRRRVFCCEEYEYPRKSRSYDYVLDIRVRPMLRNRHYY